jgi:hypothetical protein
LQKVYKPRLRIYFRLLVAIKGTMARSHAVPTRFPVSLPSQETYWTLLLLDVDADQIGYIRRYRDWSIANRPKAMNPSATAVSRNLPNGCARIVCSAPSSPCALSRSKVSAA